MIRRARLPLLSLLMLAVVGGALFVGGHVLSVHSKYGQWAWSPSAAPPRLQLGSSQYTKTRLLFEPPGLRLVGDAPGGGKLYANPSAKPLTSVVIKVSGRTVGYECSCGQG